MLWGTHKRIARSVARELNLNPRETECLEKGCIRPDYWKDYPHHYGKEHQIEKWIIEARRLFLQGQRLDSIFALGVALHYVQDRWVTLPGSDMAHSWWENQIDEAQFFVDISRLVNERKLTQTFDGSPINPVEVQNAREVYNEIAEEMSSFRQLCNHHFQGYDGDSVKNATIGISLVRRPSLGTPTFDLNFACRASLLVALSVFASETSKALGKSLRELRSEFEVKLEQAEKDLAQKLIELDLRITLLKKEHGILNALKRLICNFKIFVNRRSYEKGSHLKKVQNAYYYTAETLARAHRSWYLAPIPELDIEKVRRLLLAPA